MIDFLFRFIVYSAFGALMEIFSSGIKAIQKGETWKDKLFAEGSFPLFMGPIYGLLLTFLFDPFMNLVSSHPIFIRFFYYAIIITFTEYLLGFIFDKVFKRVPWDYSIYEDHIHTYTRYSLIAWWGSCGFWLEFITPIINYLSPFIIFYFKTRGL